MLVVDRLLGSHCRKPTLPPNVDRDGRTSAVTIGLRERTQKAVTPVHSEPMVAVTIVAGRRIGEWFVTRHSGLHDGLEFAYLDGRYIFTSDPVTGRWGAVPAPLPSEDRTRQP